MPELRVDPLTGLRTIVHAEHEATHEDLFTALPDRHTEELVVGGPSAWRDRMRTRAAPCMHLRAETIDEGTLYTLDFVPAAMARERERFGAYAARTMGGNLLADLVQEEVRRRERLVDYDAEAVVFAPYASRVDRQLTLAPRTVEKRWEEDEGTGDALLAKTLERLGPGFELWVRTAPDGADSYCWRIDIVPTLPVRDVLAAATGVHTCRRAPEAFAAQLRA